MPSSWSDKKEQALFLVFEGTLGRRAICAKLEIADVTLRTWMKEDEFKERLSAMRESLHEHLEGVAFVRKEQRILALSELALQAKQEWEEKRYLIEQRPTQNGVMINEALNSEAAKILRGALDDIAKELGDRAAKLDISERKEQHSFLHVTVSQLDEHALKQYVQVGGAQIVDAVPSSQRYIEAIDETVVEGYDPASIQPTILGKHTALDGASTTQSSSAPTEPPSSTVGGGDDAQ